MSKKRLNSAWISNISGQSANFLLFLLASPFLLEKMGEAAFGALTILYLLPQMAVQLEFGIISTVVRAYASSNVQQNHSASSQLVWEAGIILLVVGLLQSSIIICFSEQIFDVLNLSNVLDPIRFSVVTATCVWIPLMLILALLMSVLRAMEKYRQIAAISILSSSGFWGGALVLVNYTPRVDYILWGGAFVIALCMLISLMLVWSHVNQCKVKFNDLFKLQLILKHSRFSINTFISQLSSLFTYHTDKLLISAFLSPSAVGIYNIISVVASKLLVLISATSTFVYPRAVRLISLNKHEELSDVYLRVTKINMLLALSVVVPAIIFAEPFLRLWIGSELDTEYVTVMQMMFFAYFLAAFSVAASNVSIGMGDAKLPAIFAVIGGLVTLILCFLLLPEFGVIGASIAAISGMAQAVIFNCIVAKKLDLKYVKSMIWITVKCMAIFGLSQLVAMMFNLTASSWLQLLGYSLITAVFVVILWCVIDALYRPSVMKFNNV